MFSTTSFISPFALSLSSNSILFSQRLHFLAPLLSHRLTFPTNQVQVKTFDLQSKSKADLGKQLEELKTELLNLRVQKVAGGSSSKILRIKSLRKDIAAF